MPNNTMETTLQTATIFLIGFCMPQKLSLQVKIKKRKIIAKYCEKRIINMQYGLSDSTFFFSIEMKTKEFQMIIIDFDCVRSFQPH